MIRPWTWLKLGARLVHYTTVLSGINRQSKKHAPFFCSWLLLSAMLWSFCSSSYTDPCVCRAHWRVRVFYGGSILFVVCCGAWFDSPARPLFLLLADWQWPCTELINNNPTSMKSCLERLDANFEWHSTPCIWKDKLNLLSWANHPPHVQKSSIVEHN